MKTAIETLYHLTTDEISAVSCVASGCRAADDLDSVEVTLRFYFRNWFVYRGGNHVALHRTADDDRRVLIVSI